MNREPQTLPAAYARARKSPLQVFDQQAANKARRRSSQTATENGRGAALVAIERARDNLARNVRRYPRPSFKASLRHASGPRRTGRTGKRRLLPLLFLGRVRTLESGLL